MTQSLVTVVLFVLAILSIPFLLKRWQEKRGGLLPGALAAGSNAKLVSAVAVGPQQRVVTVEVGPEGARTQLVLGDWDAAAARVGTRPAASSRSTSAVAACW